MNAIPTQTGSTRQNLLTQPGKGKIDPARNRVLFRILAFGTFPASAVPHENYLRPGVGYRSFTTKAQSSHGENTKKAEWKDDGADFIFTLCFSV